MALNESVSILLDQGFQELGSVNMTFGMKLLVIFGFIYLFNSVLRSGMSVIEILLYVIAFIKWVVYKILKRDI